MSKRTGLMRAVFTVAALSGLALTAGGCGYLRNVHEDFLDLGTFALGYVPPVAPGEDGPQAIGFLPPCIGAYVEVTEFLHLGYLYKATGDVEWDRRGLGATVDKRRKIGFGPWHQVMIEQDPVCVNAYKQPEGPMQAWREHMADLSDPIFNRPGKVMIYEPRELEDEDPAFEAHIRARTGADVGATVRPVLPVLPRGWQDWETISVELAVPEPFILHSGFYLRAGFDPSQVLDLALSLLCIDLYGDAAYTFWSGDYLYTTEEQKRAAAASAAEPESPGAFDRFFGAEDEAKVASPEGE